MLDLPGVLFRAGMDFDDILCILTVWLIHILFLFYHFSLVGYNIWYCIPSEYRGTN